MLTRLTNTIKALLGGSRGKRGETLVEVLASIVIGGLALLMLAVAMSTAVNVTSSGQKNMADYDTGNNIVITQAAASSGGTVYSLEISASSDGTVGLVTSSGGSIEVKVYEADKTSAVLFEDAG